MAKDCICRARGIGLKRRFLVLFLITVGGVIACLVITNLPQEQDWFSLQTSIRTGKENREVVSESLFEEEVEDDDDTDGRLGHHSRDETGKSADVKDDKGYESFSTSEKKTTETVSTSKTMTTSESPTTTKPTLVEVPYQSTQSKTWMTWDTLDSPGSYRACVPRPSRPNMKRVITGDLIEDKDHMTITKCINICNEKKFTYAALGRGIACYCSNVKGNSSLLNYLDGALCDLPCSGDKLYHCGGEQYLSLYRTKVPDERCANRTFPAEGTFPLIALASYPRSGNTWTRKLIERATGYYTGTVYREEKNLNAFLGGKVKYTSGQTICVKTHTPHVGHMTEYNKGGVVLIIRNPYRSLVAEVYRQYRTKKLTISKDNRYGNDTAAEYFKTSEWIHYVKKQSARWKNIYTNWLTHSSRVLVIHYEDLQANSYQELNKIVKFLHVKPDRKRLLCATQEYPSSDSTGISLGNNEKEKRSYLAEDPFAPEMREMIDGYIRKVNESLAAHGLTVITSKYTNVTFF